MSTDSPTDPAPAAPEPVLAHELVPDPIDYGTGPDAALVDVVKYHLARAQGFSAGASQYVPTGDDDGEMHAWGAYVRMTVAELHLALLLAELQADTPLEVATTRVPRYIEDGGAATEWLWDHGQRLGLDLDRVRAWPLAAAIGRTAEDDIKERRRARELAAKHPHHVKPTIETGRVAWGFTCTAPDDALCRALWSCGCETWHDQRRVTTPHGPAWAHLAHDGETWHDQAGTRVGASCNVTTWLTEDGAGAEELYEGANGVAVHPGPITTTWEGDYYSWAYADGATS